MMVSTPVLIRTSMRVGKRLLIFTLDANDKKIDFNQSYNV